MTYFNDGIECPECGMITYELYKATNSAGIKILMCDACCDDTQEGIEEWDEAWDGEWKNYDLN